MKKDPGATLDYKVDWAGARNPWLSEGEVITASTWTIAPEGLTTATPAPSHTDTDATIWFSGGELGTRYVVTNHITTSQGREDERSFVIDITNR